MPDAERGLALALTRAAGREVDLVRLDHGSTLLRWQVTRDGVAILAAPPYELSHFRAQAGIEHADLRVSRDPAQRLYLARLAAAGDK